MTQKVTVKLALRRSDANGIVAGEPVEQEVQATLVTPAVNGVAVVQVGTTRFPVPAEAIVASGPAPTTSRAPLPAASPLGRFQANPDVGASLRALIKEPPPEAASE